MATAASSFTYEPVRYNLLPESYRTIRFEDWLFGLIIIALTWLDNIRPRRKPSLSKMALYFSVRFCLNLADHLIESFFDWLMGDPQPQQRQVILWQAS